MADKKISDLTSVTTPLAGTEVLPIVQSSTTKKVTTDDLTVKNVRSNATSGILQVAGPAASTIRIMTVPNANFTSARTDAAQSFTGDQTLSTGNMIVGTATKGVDFSANSNAPGMTSELLNWYEEGTWTPVLSFGGASVGMTYSVQQGYYTRIGNQVTLWMRLALTAKGSSTGSTAIAGMPFAAGVGSYGTGVFDAVNMTGLTAGGLLLMTTSPSNSSLFPLIGTTTGRAQMTNTQFTDTSDLRCSITYKV